MACAACEHIHLLVDELIVYGYVIIRHLVAAGELHVELRSNGNLELEGVRCGLLQVYRLSVFVGQRLTEHLYLIVLYVLLKALAQQLVDFVYLHCGAKLALYHAHGGLSGTESRHIGALAIIFQLLGDLVVVVCFFNYNRHQTIDFVGILKCNVHY